MKYRYLASTLCAVSMALAATAQTNINDIRGAWRQIADGGITPAAITHLTTPSAPAVKSRSYEQPQTSFTATNAEVWTLGDLLENGTNIYYLFLANMKMSDGIPAAEGQMLRALLVAPGTAEFPTGHFTLSTDENFEENTIYAGDTDYLDVFYNPEDSEDTELYGYVYTPTSGCIDITENNDGTYTVSAEMRIERYDDQTETVVESALSQVSYTGKLPMVDPYGYTPLEGDADLNGLTPSGRYTEGDYSLAFYDVALDEDGYIIGPGRLFNVELFVDNDIPMNLDKLAGTYAPVDPFTTEPTTDQFMQGVWYNFYGYYIPLGTTLSIYNDDLDVSNIGLATDGSITVTRLDGGNFRFDFDLVTVEGHTMKGSWSGDIAPYIEDFTVGITQTSADGSQEISGGTGCVHAPEGAKVYSLTGTETATDGLAAGIYIVKHNGNAVKVIVK